MKKKILGIVLALTVVTVIVAAAVQANPVDPNKEYVYGQGGKVVLKLPAGTGPKGCNKTDIAISVQDVDERSTKGAEDFLEVSLWIPSRNAYTTIAFINDNPVAIASVKKMLSGVPYIQYVQVAEAELEVWKDGDMITANLTKPIDIKFGDPLPSNSIYRELNFTLPAMTLVFVKNGPIYEKTESTTTYSGWPGASNWVVVTKRWTAPSFASVSIPAWLGSTTLPVAGYYREKISMDVTIP